MELIKGKHLGPWSLMPPPAGTCTECAVAHEPELPRNQQSMFYQYKFYNEYGRWPTWENAMAHCTDDMQEYWRRELRKRGVDI